MNIKSDGFILSLEVLLAATAFAMTAALVWSLVWGGLGRLVDSRKRLHSMVFLKSKIYESGFEKSGKDIFIKDYQDSIFGKSFKVVRTDVTEKSSLFDTGGLVKSFTFSEKEFGVKDDTLEQPTLVGFFPYLGED